MNIRGCVRIRLVDYTISSDDYPKPASGKACTSVLYGCDQHLRNVNVGGVYLIAPVAS